MEDFQDLHNFRWILLSISHLRTDPFKLLLQNFRLVFGKFKTYLFQITFCYMVIGMGFLLHHYDVIFGMHDREKVYLCSFLSNFNCISWSPVLINHKCIRLMGYMLGSQLLILQHLKRSEYKKDFTNKQQVSNVMTTLKIQSVKNFPTFWQLYNCIEIRPDQSTVEELHEWRNL